MNIILYQVLKNWITGPGLQRPGTHNKVTHKSVQRLWAASKYEKKQIRKQPLQKGISYLKMNNKRCNECLEVNITPEEKMDSKIRTNINQGRNATLMLDQ